MTAEGLSGAPEGISSAAVVSSFSELPSFLLLSSFFAPSDNEAFTADSSETCEPSLPLYLSAASLSVLPAALFPAASFTSASFSSDFLSEASLSAASLSDLPISAFSSFDASSFSLLFLSSFFDAKASVSDAPLASSELPVVLSSYVTDLLSSSVAIAVCTASPDTEDISSADTKDTELSTIVDAIKTDIAFTNLFFIFPPDCFRKDLIFQKKSFL